MAFASSVGLGIRQGSLKTTTQSLKTRPIRLSRSHARLFSTVLLPSTCTGHRVTFASIPSLGSRKLSLWGSGSKPTPPPIHESSKSSAEETLTDAVTDSAASAPVDGASTPSSDSPLYAASSIPSPEASSAAETITNSTDPSPVLSGITDTLATHAPAVLQYGDLAAMGLAGWSPAGIIRWSFELIHVSTGMPWFWTIVAGSALWRLLCVPLAIKGLQASSRLQSHQKELSEMQANLKRAQETRDTYELQKAAVMMRQFYKKHDINPLGGVISLLQMPITLGTFFGVQKLCTAPLEQLKDSGFSLLPDLTVPDPTYIMPLVLFSLVNTQIIVGTRDINTAEKPDMAHFMNIFRIITIPGIYFMAQFPSGLMVSLITTSCLTIAQTLFLRLPAIRRYFGMPIPPPSAQGRLPPIMSTFRRIKTWFSDDINNRMEKARRLAIERQQAAKRMSKRPPRL